MKRIVIIPSGGSGQRVGSSLPKQYIKINGKELIYYTLKVFQDSPEIDEIVLAAQCEYFTLIEDLAKINSITKISGIVEGGNTRQESVYKALLSLNPEDNPTIIVHDAVRPFLTSGILSEGIRTAEKEGAAVTAIPATDTLLTGKNYVSEYLDRTGIFYVQTPQVFKYDIIKFSFDKAKEENFAGTDESMIVKNAGYNIKIINGSPLNMKITTKDDFEIADNILSKSFG